MRLLELEATRQEIESVGVTCRAYAGNAADFAETENVVKQIREDFGSIDILVNNATKSVWKTVPSVARVTRDEVSGL